MMRVRRTIFAPALALAAALTAGPATACFFHGLSTDGFAVAHPTSMRVALATRKAQEQGLLPPVPRGDRRALTRLSVVNAYLPRLAADTLAAESFPAFSVLLLQSQTWTRYAPEPASPLIEGHRAGPEPGDAVVVLADTTLRALLGGELELDAASAADLVAISGPALTERILQALLDDFRQSAVGRVAALGDAPSCTVAAGDRCHTGGEVLDQ